MRFFAVLSISFLANCPYAASASVESLLRGGMSEDSPCPSPNQCFSHTFSLNRSLEKDLLSTPLRSKLLGVSELPREIDETVTDGEGILTETRGKSTGDSSSVGFRDDSVESYSTDSSPGSTNVAYLYGNPGDSNNKKLQQKIKRILNSFVNKCAKFPTYLGVFVVSSPLGRFGFCPFLRR